MEIREDVMVKYVSLFFLVVLFVGCMIQYEFVELPMPKKNPTSYQFNSSVRQVQEAIKKGNYPCFFLSEYHYGELDSLWKKENENDIIIGPIVRPSYIYKGIDRPIEYTTKFYLHLATQNDSITAVTIKTYYASIWIGESIVWRIFQGHPGTTYNKNVEPSSIEEYQLLLDIGERLGVKDKMLPIIYPEGMKN